MGGPLRLKQRNEFDTNVDSQSEYDTIFMLETGIAIIEIAKLNVDKSKSQATQSSWLNDFSVEWLMCLCSEWSYKCNHSLGKRMKVKENNNI